MKVRTLLVIALLTAAGIPVADAAKLKVPQHYPTINAAIGAAGAGDVVVISAGTYTEVVVIDGKTDVKIRGKGKVIIDPVGEGSGVQVIDCDDITLSRLRVRDAVGHGIVVSASQNVCVERCDVRSTAGYGIRVLASHSILLEKNRVRKTDSIAINVEAVGVDIRNNTISDLKGVRAIQVMGHNIMVEGNEISDLFGAGIAVAGGPSPSQVVIADNTIRSSLRGIRLFDGASGVTIVANQILKSTGAGIFTLTGSSHVILDNRVTRSGSIGFCIDVNDSVVGGNEAVRCNNGMELYGDDNDIFNNKMLRSKDSGFILGMASQGNLICGNVIKKSGGFDLLLYADPLDNDLMNNKYKTVGP